MHGFEITDFKANHILTKNRDVIFTNYQRSILQMS
jgi:hypothetical protein